VFSFDGFSPLEARGVCGRDREEAILKHFIMNME